MEIIKITKYGVYSYGVKPHVKGSLLEIKDVEEILIHILDDDELVRERVIAFLNELQEDGK